nr:integrase, catalytic region, zinc finger, CCHC-type, peptidase aspartic, catalytic [Tanacetum cinerariifolium]
YYELLKGKKPNVSYFKVFGSLCYPTNYYDDVGKLKAKADIVIQEDAHAITDESQTPPPDTSVVNEGNLDDVDDGNVFEPYVADEEASSSNTADVNVTHNSPPP